MSKSDGDLMSLKYLNVEPEMIQKKFVRKKSLILTD